LAELLAERGERYGDFAKNAATAQALKAQLRASESWPQLRPEHQQALDAIMDKVSRVLSGDPDYQDNWRDIAGYATLAVQGAG
jgi:hypothetical protein